MKERQEKKKRIYLALGRMLYGFLLPGFAALLVASQAAQRITGELQPLVAQKFYLPLGIWAGILLIVIIIRAVMKKETFS